MKKFMMRRILVGVLIFTGGMKVFAQTTLSAGDIAFTMYNSGPNSSATTPQHEFSFVTLVGLASGTTIYFTDVGVDNTGAFLAAGGSARESAIQYTTSGTVAAGTQITIGNDYTSAGATSLLHGTGTVTMVTGSPFGAAGTSLLLSQSGDSLIAYTASSATSTPTFITALDDVSGGGWTSGATGVNQSALPTGLADGTSALSFDFATAKYAQFKFSSIGGTISSSNSKSAWEAILNDTTNWNVSTSAGYTSSTTSLTVTAIPEPSSYVVLAGLASFGLALRLRRRKI
ncbi:MAG: PEP-CTERM sorting domain-containing protein [Verrucomicrobia bacterium]|nr:PEP-CTERM sorting domain-containing protein [Verrucomicrobiota bacterium]